MNITSTSKTEDMTDLQFHIGNHMVTVDILGLSGTDIDYKIRHIEELDTAQYYGLDYDALWSDIYDYCIEEG